MGNDGTCVDISEMTIVNHGWSQGSGTPSCYPRPFSHYNNGVYTRSSDFNFYYYNNKWIIIPTETLSWERLSWTNAQAECQLFSGVNNGGTLVTDFYETELEFLRNMLGQYHSSSQANEWWVGLGYGGYTNDGLWWWWDQNGWGMRFPDYLNYDHSRDSWDSNYGFIAGPTTSWQYQNYECKHACLGRNNNERGHICELR